MVGQRIRPAVERHERDLQNAAKRGLRFDPDKGQRVLTFFALLRHSKGEWAGQPFVLSP